MRRDVRRRRERGKATKTNKDPGDQRYDQVKAGKIPGKPTWTMFVCTCESVYKTHLDDFKVVGLF